MKEGTVTGQKPKPQQQQQQQPLRSQPPPICPSKTIKHHHNCRDEENSKAWFRFEMLRMSCVIFIASMSIFLKEDTMPTRPLPNHLTQIGSMHNVRKNLTGTKNINNINNRTRTNTTTTTLLSVPFYVYESLLWDNMTFFDVDHEGDYHNDSSLDTTTAATLLLKRQQQQSGDYWFMKAALEHPMRTFDPDSAVLFVIPSLMNLVIEGMALTKRRRGYYRRRHNGNHNQTQSSSSSSSSSSSEKEEEDAMVPAAVAGVCNHNGTTTVCNEQLIKQVETILSNSVYYQRSNGSDHIMVLSHWFASKNPQIRNSSIFRNINMIRHDDRNLALPTTNRTTFPTIQVGNPCPSIINEEMTSNNNTYSTTNTSSDKTSNWVLVVPDNRWKSTIPSAEQQRNNKGLRLTPEEEIMCDWLSNSQQQQQQQQQYNSSSSTCGGMLVQGGEQQCPALAQSRYGFHVVNSRRRRGWRGDDISRLLIDTLLSGTVPIVITTTATTTEDAAAAATATLPTWIDWKLLSVKVDMTMLGTLLNNATIYQEKMNHISSNRDLFDWRTGVPFDVYMFLFQREIVPGSIIDGENWYSVTNPYNFSALKI